MGISYRMDKQRFYSLYYIYNEHYIHVKTFALSIQPAFLGMIRYHLWRIDALFQRNGRVWWTDEMCSADVQIIKDVSITFLEDANRGIRKSGNLLIFHYNGVYVCVQITTQFMHRTLSHILSALSTSRTTSKLVDFSTCEISDALLKLKLPHGGYIPDINMFSPSNPSLRICGPAYTVRFVLGSDTTAPKLSAHFVDTTPKGSIIVISSPPG